MKNFYVFLIFTLISILFYFFAEVDLWFSGLFFNSEDGFLYQDQLWAQAISFIFQNIPFLLAPLFFLPLVLGIKFEWFKQRRRLTVFMLLVLIMGPGLIVNGALKNNWDRARPKDVVEFGGDMHFSPAWVISDQCDNNCSFVSGHASMAFSAMLLGWLFASYRWLLVGVALGLLMGLARILEGDHFLSDVIMAGFIVYFVIAFIARILSIPEPK